MENLFRIVNQNTTALKKDSDYTIMLAVPSAVQDAQTYEGFNLGQCTLPLCIICCIGTSLLDDGADLVDEGEGGGAEDVRSPSMGSEGNEDDVVHCVCGSEVDEGFMIQVGVLLVT